MMLIDAKYIQTNLKYLKQIRKPREATWNDIIDYVLPYLQDIDLYKLANQGGRIGVNRYDGSGVNALQLFADGLYGYYIAPSIAWLKLKMKDYLMDIPEVRQWLQDVEEHYYGVFSRSNFYNAISTYFERAPSFGHAVMYAEEDIENDGIVFHNYHPGECYIAEDKYGRVDTVYRECKYDARTAVKKFGYKNLTSQIQDAVKNDNSLNQYRKFDFIHAVFPNSDRKPGKIDSKNKKYASTWMQIESDIRNPDGKIVLQSGYDRFPYMVWRFKEGVTPYGTGPAEDSLIEVMGSNVISKSLLLAAEKSVDPPYNIPSEMEGKVELIPRGYNYYTNPDLKIEPVSQGIDFPIGIDREERMQKAIEKHFKVEFFVLLASLEGTAKTATEIIELAGEKAAVLSRPLTRLNNECLNPIIDIIFDIELKSGRLPEIPQVLQEIQGEPIDVDYMGPLAQAQKKHFQVQGVEQSLAIVGPILEINPESRDIIDWDGTVKDVLQVTGFPQKRINTPEEIEKIRKARMNVEMAQAAKEDLSQMADTTEKMAKADKSTGGQLMEMIQSGGA